MSIQTFTLPALKVLTVTAGPQACTFYTLAGGVTGTPVDVEADASGTAGPFGVDKSYAIDSPHGQATYAITTPDLALESDVAAIEARTAITDVTELPEVETVTIESVGNQYNRITTLTLADHVIGTAGDDANKAIGALVATLPAGKIIVTNYSVSIALTLDSDVVSDTPDVGLGTEQAEGSSPTLSAAGAATENILTGTAAADVDGTPLVAVNGVGPLFIETEDDHTIYLNVADGWADSSSGTLALTATGTIRLFWQWLGV